MDKLSKSKGFDFAKKYYLSQVESPPDPLFNAKMSQIAERKDPPPGEKARSGVFDQTDQQIRDMIGSPQREQRPPDAPAAS